MLMAKSSVRTVTQRGYDYQWALFGGYCARVHRPAVSPLLLWPTILQCCGVLMAAFRAEVVLIGFVGWMACLLKQPTKGIQRARAIAMLVAPGAGVGGGGWGSGS